MASSNRHWPSMFKSKPCNNQEWSQPHQPSILSNNSCGRSSSSSITNSPFSSVCEERSPEPKPRWNPKPEQIRILEAIFNSGMVNPPRDEIRRIRAQLQEYGQVGDANVFYWFQNRKSRSKHKQRTLDAKITATTATTKATTKTLGTHHSPPLAASSFSSSEKASPRKVAPSPRSGGGSSYGSSNNSINNSNVVVEQFGISPTSVNQSSNTYFHQLVSPHNNNNHTSSTTATATTTNTTTLEFVSQEPLFFPLHQSGASVVGNNFSQGLCFGTSPQHDGSGGGGGGVVGGFSSFLLGDMFGGGGLHGGGDDHLKRGIEMEQYKFQHELSILGTSPTNVTTCTISPPSPVVLTPPSSAISSSLGQILGLGEGGGLAGKTTVFINGMAIEVPVGPLNIKEEFGEDAILIHSSSGHPVATNEWGITLHPLQNGASYYLVSSVAASPLLDKLDTTPDVLAQGFPYQI